MPLDPKGWGRSTAENWWKVQEDLVLWLAGLCCVKYEAVDHSQICAERSERNRATRRAEGQNWGG